MLILSRRKNEQIVVSGGGLAEDVIIEIIEIKGHTVRIGILAPPEVAVDRLEVAEAKRNYPRMLD